MASSTQYFMIPFENVPQNPDYQVWFASWSTQRPTLEPGMQAPVVVGATTGPLPAGAVPLTAGGKDPPPPPPPLAAGTPADYQAALAAWVQLTRDA